MTSRGMSLATAVVAAGIATLSCGPCGTSVVDAESETIESSLSAGQPIEYRVQLNRNGWDEGAPLMDTWLWFCSDRLDPPNAAVDMTFECYGSSTSVRDPGEPPTSFDNSDGCGLHGVITYELLSDLTRIGGCRVGLALAEGNEASEPVVLEWHAGVQLVFGDGDVNVDLGIEITEVEPE